MLATVPGGPKTSYVMCLGLKDEVPPILISAYNGRSSAPKTPCSRDTVHPPAPITVKMTNGIHTRLRTLKIANSLHPYPYSASCHPRERRRRSAACCCRQRRRT